MVEAKQLMDTTSAVTRRMIAESDARHGAEMASVSPEGHLAGLTTPVYPAAWRGATILFLRRRRSGWRERFRMER